MILQMTALQAYFFSTYIVYQSSASAGLTFLCNVCSCTCPHFHVHVAVRRRIGLEYVPSSLSLIVLRRLQLLLVKLRPIRRGVCRSRCVCCSGDHSGDANETGGVDLWGWLTLGSGGTMREFKLKSDEGSRYYCRCLDRYLCNKIRRQTMRIRRKHLSTLLEIPQSRFGDKC